MATFSEPCPSGGSLGELIAWRFRRDEALKEEQKVVEETSQPIPTVEKPHD